MDLFRRVLACLLFVAASPVWTLAQGFDVIFDDGFDGCSGLRKYVYVFTSTAHLLRFDPRRIGTASTAFEDLGTPTCPVGPPLPGWLGVFPYSLSVAQDGQLWALFTSGQIFRIDPVSLACTDTGFAYTDDWQLFAIAFAGRSGGAVEPLATAGGSLDPAQIGNLGRIDPVTLQAVTVAPLGAPASAEFSPSLTGVGESELFGFYPSTGTQVVQQIDRTTGQLIGTARAVPDTANPDQVAWAFAHWGGFFWLFLTDQEVAGPHTRLVKMERSTGAAMVAMVLPFTAVAAGVSTCVPTAIR
jgi:hypothetical protein